MDVHSIWGDILHVCYLEESLAPSLGLGEFRFQGLRQFAKHTPQPATPRDCRELCIINVSPPSRRVFLLEPLPVVLLLLLLLKLLLLLGQGVGLPFKDEA